MIRIVRALSTLFLAAGLVLGGILIERLCLDRPPPKVDVTLTLLRSEPMLFLVTRRGSSQVLVHHTETRWWGDWQGVLWATVHWRWGVDLSELTRDDLRRAGRTFVVRLPEPALLDFGIEPGSMGMLSKSTALPKLRDLAGSGLHRQVLEDHLREAMLHFAHRHNLLPDRQELLERLNAAVTALGQSDSLRFE
jgi:hypothetical protein